MVPRSSMINESSDFLVNYTIHKQRSKHIYMVADVIKRTLKIMPYWCLMTHWRLRLSLTNMFLIHVSSINEVFLKMPNTIDSRLYMIWQCTPHNNYNDKTSVRFACTKDTPYVALTGELWGVYRELYEEKWPRYIESALYYKCTHLFKSVGNFQAHKGCLCRWIMLYLTI